MSPADRADQQPGRGTPPGIPRPRRILINDRDARFAQELAAILARQGKALDVLTSTDGTEAMEIIRRLPVDLVITGLQGGKMDGFQLLAELGFYHRTVKVIVLIGPQIPLPRAAIRTLGADAVFRKPFSLAELTERACAELQVRCRGEVWGIHLASFLQMLHADAKTCALTVSTPTQSGQLFLVSGELHAAECGGLAGDDALYTIMSWDNPFIQIDYLPFDKTRNVSAGLMAMLLESQRRKDESAVAKAQLRQHARFNCLVAADFDLERGSYRHLIRNMSEGGAFIESDAEAKVGEEMELLLYAIKLRRHCTLRGRVVRCDPRGFGVKFEDVNDEKRAFLQALQAD